MSKVSPIPKGYHSITPYLVIRGAALKCGPLLPFSPFSPSLMAPSFIHDPVATVTSRMTSGIPRTG